MIEMKVHELALFSWICRLREFKNGVSSNVVIILVLTGIDLITCSTKFNMPIDVHGSRAPTLTIYYLPSTKAL